MESDLSSLLNEVSLIYELYKNDDYMKNKLISVVKNMKNSLNSIEDEREKREQRKKNLQDDSDMFVKKFLNNNKYFHISISEIFFEYDNINYYIKNEDDIQYKILSSISNNKNLMPWKYKIKNNILKKIKETDLFTSIPESETIQNTINLLTKNIFINKSYTKYFLTILGDILLKKTTNLYFINHHLKYFIKQINDQAYLLFGIVDLGNHFKYKYYEQKFNDCRLIKTKNNSTNISNENILNLLCVSAYHSNRYINGDNFLTNHCKDSNIINHIFYLKNKNLQEIIDNFMSSMIERSDKENNKLKWTEIVYLWKLYVKEQDIPNVCFSSVLKDHLKNLLYKDYVADPEVFNNLTSKYLPNILIFNEFWKSNIKEDNGNELEIDELHNLFKNYNPNNQMSEEKIIDLIKHYYPDIQIEEDKYLLNISCKLWNKNEDIINFISEISDNSEDEEYSFDTLYNLYLKKKYKVIVSKRYFEKFLSMEYTNLIHL